MSAPRTPCSVPLPITLRDALEAADPLARLQARLAESAERFRAIGSVLPPDLLACTRPGPVDGTEWTLWVPHAAAAAKLRHWCPALVQTLTEAGWQGTAIRVRVQRP